MGRGVLLAAALAPPLEGLLRPEADEPALAPHWHSRAKDETTPNAVGPSPVGPARICQSNFKGAAGSHWGAGRGGGLGRSNACATASWLWAAQARLRDGPSRQSGHKLGGQMLLNSLPQGVSARPQASTRNN